MKEWGALGSPSRAIGINDHGQAVGFFGGSDGLPRGRVRLRHQWSTSVGMADGLVRGGSEHAFVCCGPAEFRDLGTLGGPTSFALGINNRGEVVGFSGVARGEPQAHAFLWRQGRMLDLNSLVARPAGWRLTTASAINDGGQIAGTATAPDGSVRAFLLAPLATDGQRGTNQEPRRRVGCVFARTRQPLTNYEKPRVCKHAAYSSPFRKGFMQCCRSAVLQTWRYVA